MEPGSKLLFTAFCPSKNLVLPAQNGRSSSRFFLEGLGLFPFPLLSSFLPDGDGEDVLEHLSWVTLLFECGTHFLDSCCAPLSSSAPFC